MFSNFRKTFKLRDGEKKRREEYFDKLIQDCIKRRENIRLVKRGDLYMSEPFGTFVGDCDSCSHSYGQCGVSEGALCDKHHITCGYGFTCPDNDSEQNVGWEEFEKIKGEIENAVHE